MSEEQFAALSLVGKGAVIVFMLAAIYAIGAALALVPHIRRFRDPEFDVLKDAELRRPFLRFAGFCAVATLTVLFGLTFGGWPTIQ